MISCPCFCMASYNFCSTSDSSTSWITTVRGGSLTSGFPSSSSVLSLLIEMCLRSFCRRLQSKVKVKKILTLRNNSQVRVSVLLDGCISNFVTEYELEFVAEIPTKVTKGWNQRLKNMSINEGVNTENELWTYVCVTSLSGGPMNGEGLYSFWVVICVSTPWVSTGYCDGNFSVHTRMRHSKTF